jgi:hypothetical protein
MIRVMVTMSYDVLTFFQQHQKERSEHHECIHHAYTMNAYTMLTP